MIKQGFNLIEIALAVAIIAVGMSSILVLFPVGMNASSAAAADSMIPDVADYVLGYLECRTQAAWRDAAGKETENKFVGKLATSLNEEDDDRSVSWPDDPITNTNLKSGSLGGKTIFLYEQSYTVNGASVTDFSAVIQVWTEKIPLRLRTTAAPTAPVTKQTGDPTKSEEEDRYALALCAEISYPAEKPRSERERYQFRREIYNHAQ